MSLRKVISITIWQLKLSSFDIFAYLEKAAVELSELVGRFRGGAVDGAAIDEGSREVHLLPATTTT